MFHCDNELMKFECWRTAYKRFKHHCWINSHLAWSHVNGGKVANMANYKVEKWGTNIQGIAYCKFGTDGGGEKYGVQHIYKLFYPNF